MSFQYFYVLIALFTSFSIIHFPVWHDMRRAPLLLLAMGIIHYFATSFAFALLLYAFVFLLVGFSHMSHLRQQHIDLSFSRIIASASLPVVNIAIACAIQQLVFRLHGDNFLHFACQLFLIVILSALEAYFLSYTKTMRAILETRENDYTLLLAIALNVGLFLAHYAFPYDFFVFPHADHLSLGNAILLYFLFFLYSLLILIMEDHLLHRESALFFANRNLSETSKTLHLSEDHLRKQTHEFMNVMSLVRSYLENNSSEDALRVIINQQDALLQEREKPLAPDIDKELRGIQNAPLKDILKEKLELMIHTNPNLQVNLIIRDFDTEQLYHRFTEQLHTIIANLLSNACDELHELYDQNVDNLLLNVVFFAIDDEFDFSVTNSCRQGINMQQIEEDPYYSTKGAHHGHGLQIIRAKMKDIPHGTMKLSNNVQDHTFTAEIYLPHDEGDDYHGF